MQPNPPRPTDAELEILTVLWSRGASTVRDVYENIAARKPTQYTTVLKMMQIMAEKGLVRRNEEQRAHVYEASRPQEWTQQQLAGDLLRRALQRLRAKPDDGGALRQEGHPRRARRTAQAARRVRKGGEMTLLTQLDPDARGASAGWTLFHFLWEGIAIAAALALALLSSGPRGRAISPLAWRSRRCSLRASVHLCACCRSRRARWSPCRRGAPAAALRC